MRMPALAVVGADHQIIRSTETFRLKCENPVALCESSAELDLVLTGETDNAVLDVGDFSLAIEAVTDATGKRQAMLSLPAEDLAGDPDTPLAALREAADESPAIVWAKDLDGRYLYANVRYESDLEITEERLLGHTDADLPPALTVDGPRLRYTEDGLKEPLQLEYNVPPIDSRPSMVAFRFPLRNGHGQPVGTCGVAAPSNEAQVARDEAVRLMQLERWNRLDPRDVRAELLEQWHVRATAGPVVAAKPEALEKARSGRVKLFSKRARADEVAPPKEDPANEPIDPEELQSAAADPEAVAPVEAPAPIEPAVEAEGEAAPAAVEPEQEDARPSPNGDQAPYRREDEWVRQLRQAARMSGEDAGAGTADALQSDLQLARTWAERADQLQGDLHEAHARILEAEAEVQQARVEAHQAHAEGQAAHAEAQQAHAEAQQVHFEAEQARAEAEQARAEAEQAHAEAEQAGAAAQLAAEESTRLRAELGQLRAELEREKTQAQAARAEVEVAQRELGDARAEADSLREPADTALRLSEELERALAAEQERGDELAHTLVRIQARLGELDAAVESKPAAAQPA